MLFTRDLRVHDNPALHAACAAGRTVPVFVWDEEILAGPMAVPNRLRFLADCLEDLRGSLRRLGGDLVVRRGEPAAVVGRIARSTGARSLYLADDHSVYARRRLRALRELPLRVNVLPGVTVVPPGRLRPSSGGDHYRVFTPYWRAWSAVEPGPLLPPPGRVVLPEGLDSAAPADPPSCAGHAPGLEPGGEGRARRRLAAWVSDGLRAYEADRDRLARCGTSRLSAHLRFGTLSPREVLHATAGCEPFTRQLAWRDFHYQIAAAFPGLAWRDYRPRRAEFRDDPDALAAWCGAATGIPVVDAALRQLHHEGFMHNRARMITASFLTRVLRLDWRHGHDHFRAHLADGDIPNNAANWQRLAGTGNDPRPRTLNPLRQASRFDPDGSYTRRWLPELAALEGASVHRPWTAPPALRRTLDYPAPLVDPDDLGRRR